MGRHRDPCGVKSETLGTDREYRDQTEPIIIKKKLAGSYRVTADG